MAIQPVPDIDPAPTPGPQRGDESTFDDRMDASIRWFEVSPAQYVAMGDNVHNNATEAFNSAASALLSKNAAATSETNAASSAATALNAPGTSATSITSLSIGVGVKSFTLAQAGKLFVPGQWLMFADTSAPGTNWMTGPILTFNSGTGVGTMDANRIQGSGTISAWTVSLSPPAPVIAPQIIKVKDLKSSGTGAGTAVSADITQTRVLNTTESNTIPGASLSSNSIILPAGTYDARVRAPCGAAGAQHKVFLYNSTDSVYTLLGMSELGPSTSEAFGRFTIAAQKTFTIRHWTTTLGGGASSGLGNPSGSGQFEIYAEAEFIKVT